jgi:TrmH family RNA methyltransferase
MTTTDRDVITSSKNQHIQLVRELLAKKNARESRGLFILEGVRLAEEALANGFTPKLVLYSEACSARGLDLVQQAAEAGCVTYPVKRDILDALSDTETTQGLLMVMPVSPHSLPSHMDFMLVIDQVRDPGNLGTILRSAVAAGVQAVCCTPGSVDAWSPKVVRSGMGAHFHTPILNKGWEEIRKICKNQENPLTLCLAESGGGTSLWEADLRQPLALVIGGEADGATPAVKESVDLYLNIPMPGGFESLNAGVAASILIFEVVRQRKQH